jgi:hypothetical protein
MKKSKYNYVMFFTYVKDNKEHLVGHIICTEEIPSLEGIDYNKKEVIEDAKLNLTIDDLRVIMVSSKMIYQTYHHMFEGK